MVNDRLPRRADVRAIGRPHQSGLLRRRRWLDLKTRRTVHWRSGTKGDAGAVCIAHATRSSETAKKTDRPAASAEPTRDMHRHHRALQPRSLPTMSLQAQELARAARG